MQKTSLTSLKNIGKTLAAKLVQIGITNEADLKKVGAAKAFKWLSERSPGKRLPLCYYLYSLEGAISNRDWRDLSEIEKEKLRVNAGIVE